MAHANTATTAFQRPRVSRGIFGLYYDFFYYVFFYREYLKQSVARDLRKKYKRSVLGYFWSMLQPLLMMAILAVVFSNIMRQNIEDYAVFLFTAMLPWGYFDGVCNVSLGTIRSNARIIDQLPVPKFIFPVAGAFYQMVNFCLSLVPLFVVMLVLGRSVPVTILGLPLIMLSLFCLSVGVGLILAVANVFFEDVQHLTSIVLRALYFLSPILYGRDQLPEWLVQWVVFNPMFCLIESMRSMFYYGEMPDMQIYLLNFVGCFAILGLGLWIFRRADDKFQYFL